MPQTQPTTLIVEDNETARQGLVELLQHQGFEVTAAENGKEALDFLRVDAPPDVIILDMLLPVMDGWRFLDEFKRMNVKPKPWIVLATGSPAISREWAADHGCGGFLRKPIDAARLLAEMQRCLSQTTEMEV